MDARRFALVSQRMSQIISLLLWESGAIKVDLKDPFKLVSGNYSPIYVNCRQLISDTLFMHLFTAFGYSICRQKHVEVDVVAGSETAGIPFAAYLAQGLNSPMIYVRKGAKDHGLSTLVEGSIGQGSRVLLVDDVITDAGSKLNFVRAISERGGSVKNVLVVFDRQQSGAQTLRDLGIQLHSITNIETSLQVAEEAGLLTEDEFTSVRQYLRDPELWHKGRHLPFSGRAQ